MNNVYFISVPIIVGIILGIYVTSNLVSDSINDQLLLTNTQLMKNGSPEMGLVNAPISIVEFGDYQCTFCYKFHQNTLNQIKIEYIDTGKANYIFRDFPLNYPALMGSIVLRCVPQDIRYEYQEALYELQSKWVFRDTAKTKQELYKIMQSGGMKKEEFDKCIENVDLENEILVGLMNAQEEFNIKSTPSFIINGEVVGGNKSIKVFRQIIDKSLSE